MTDQDDFVTIRPRPVTLSHRDETPPPTTDSTGPSPSNQRWIYIGLGVLVLLGLWVFVFLPGQVTAPARPPVSDAAPPSQAPVATPTAPSTSEPAPPPYQQLQAERERKRAQETLSGFVELQIELEEEMHVDLWAAEAFDDAQTLANEGDELFAEEQFEEAIARYAEGVAALEALVELGKQHFEAALAEGREALAALDANAATAAFERAAQVYPDHADVRAGLQRAANLPEVLDRLALAAELRTDGDIEAARETYLSIRQLDPATPGIDEALAELDALVEEIRFQTLLSDGYAALNAGQFGAARNAFNAALKMRAGSTAARAGLEQVGQASTLSRIDRLRAQAERQEADEEWAAAQASYEEVLGIEGTLKFAKEGRSRCAARAKLDEQLADTIDQPELLSSDERFESAVALYQRAADVRPAGPRLSGQLDQLEAILEHAAQPVPVTLVSDNATEITVFQVGFLGVFEQKQLSLRPGRYVIKGSRNGCRDVRLEIDVEPDMAPLDVRCQERL